MGSEMCIRDSSRISAVSLSFGKEGLCDGKMKAKISQARQAAANTSLERKDMFDNPTIRVLLEDFRTTLFSA